MDMIVLYVLIAIIAVWDIIWKGIGLWKSARHQQSAWFVVILILNTAGLLPIIYLLFFQRKRTALRYSRKVKRRKKVEE